MATLIRGVVTDTHPHWSTGEPILWGDDVRTPDGWSGFVTGMHPDEVLVTAYSDDADYEEEFSPDDLRLVALGPAHAPMAEDR